MSLTGIATNPISLIFILRVPFAALPANRSQFGASSDQMARTFQQTRQPNSNNVGMYVPSPALSHATTPPRDSVCAIVRKISAVARKDAWHLFHRAKVLQVLVFLLRSRE